MADGSTHSHNRWLDNFDGMRNQLESDAGLQESLSEVGRIGATIEFDAYRSRVEGLQAVALHRARSLAAIVDVASLIVVVGLPRTGTTALHWMLQGARVGDAPMGWQVHDPRAISGDSKARDRAQEDYRLRVELASSLSERLMRLHPMGVDTPEECTPVLAASLLTLQTPMMFGLNGLVDRILHADRGWVYDMWACYVRELSYHRDQVRPLVLKSPMQLLGYREILRCFPNTLLIQVRRDRRDVMTSLLNLVEVSRGLFSRSVNPEALGAEWLGHMKAVLTRAEEDARAVAGQLMVFEHDELCRSPAQVVREIAQRAESHVESKNSIGELAALARQSHSARLRPLSYFGLTEEQVLEELAPCAGGFFIS